jgi:hypothetical protein
MGSRVADAPVRSTVVAAKTDRREDLAIMMMVLCKCAQNERQEVKETTDFVDGRARERAKGSWLPCQEKTNSSVVAVAVTAARRRKEPDRARQSQTEPDPAPGASERGREEASQD